MIETLRGRVTVAECDPSGRMSVPAHAARIADATVSLCHAIGLTGAFVIDRRRTLVTVSQQIAYTGDLVAGDLLVMYGGVLSIGEDEIRFVHRMLRVEDGAAIMSANALMRGTDIEHWTPIALDDAIAARARRLLVHEAQA
jgi:acyl-CoA thioesterase FadM